MPKTKGVKSWIAWPPTRTKSPRCGRTIPSSPSATTCLKDFQQAIDDLSEADAEFVSKDVELTAAKNERKDKVARCARWSPAPARGSTRSSGRTPRSISNPAARAPATAKSPRAVTGMGTVSPTLDRQ